MQFKLNCLKYFRRFPAHKQTKILTSAMHEDAASIFLIMNVLQKCAKKQRPYLMRKFIIMPTVAKNKSMQNVITSKSLFDLRKTGSTNLLHLQCQSIPNLQKLSKFLSTIQ